MTEEAANPRRKLRLGGLQVSLPWPLTWMQSIFVPRSQCARTKLKRSQVRRARFLQPSNRHKAQITTTLPSSFAITLKYFWQDMGCGYCSCYWRSLDRQCGQPNTFIVDNCVPAACPIDFTQLYGSAVRTCSTNGRPSPCRTKSGSHDFADHVLLS